MSSQNRNVRPNKLYAERVIAGFERDGNQWLLSAKIGEYLPEGVSNSSRYNTIHAMSSCTPVLLEKEPYQNGVYRYRLAPDYKQAMLSLFPGLPAIKALVSQIPTDGIPGMTHRVKWDEGERILMIEQVRELRRKYIGMTVLDAARKAQDILIEQGLIDRSHKRPLSSQSAIQFIIDALFNDDGTAKPDPADEPVVADVKPESTPGMVPIKPEPAPEAAPEPAVAAPTAAEPPPPLSLGQAIDTLLPAFMASIGDAFAARLQKAVADGIAEGLARRPASGFLGGATLDSLFAALPRTEVKAAPLAESVQAGAETDAEVKPAKPPKHNPEPPASEKDKRPKLLIMGMRPDEKQILLKEFGEVFDLRFWHPDESNVRLKEIARTVSHAFALINRLYHKSSENLVTGAGVRYTRVSGNVNQMQEVLTAYFAEQPS